MAHALISAKMPKSVAHQDKAEEGNDPQTALLQLGLKYNAMFLETFPCFSILRNNVCSVFSILPRVGGPHWLTLCALGGNLPWEQKQKKEASADKYC